MLQQTQVKTVIPYWERWMKALPTVEALARISSDRLHKLWEGLGYYNRVRNLQKAARVIVDEHRGQFPTDFEQILSLPGIGRYTAGAIASLGFNAPTPVVDGNVIRVLTRLFALSGNPREKTTNSRLWQLAEKLVTAAANQNTGQPGRRACGDLNESLMELGAVICLPRQPRCEACPVRLHCQALAKGQVDRFPTLPSRTPTTTRRFVAFVAESQGRLLVRQRPAGVVNAHLWEFPNVELHGKRSLPRLAETTLGTKVGALELLGTLTHSITRYRITVEIYHVPLAKPNPATAGRWLRPADLRRLAFASAHKQILARVTRDPVSA